MHHVNLGRCGLRVSRIGLGGFGFGDPAWQAWFWTKRAPGR